MKVTWNWLSEFVGLEMPLSQLAERLTMAGFAVDAVEEHGRELANVRCAEIVQVRSHPHAAHLSLCDVRLESDAIVSVVCGAPNLRAGDRVAYAPPGTTLPGGRRIDAAEIHGVPSAGMLCSEAELDLGNDATQLLALPGNAAIGSPVSAILGLEDTVLDIDVTPNRGDCLSILGMAREIAGLTGQRLRRQPLALREAPEAAADLIAIRIEDTDLCARYIGRVISGVRIGPAPLHMQSRLRAVGLRPINNVVDTTNYVMIERGQPLHAFDYDRLPRAEIVVRRARGVGSFTTLDGQSRQLESDDLLITSGNQPVAIAGVMGGADSEVTPDTSRILLESAWFLPASVRRTAKRLGMRSEASFRFERGTDIEGVGAAADRAAALMAGLTGGRVATGNVDVYPTIRRPAPIALRLKRVGDILGIPVSRTEVISKLKALCVSISPAARGTLTAVPPTHRSDLTREIDLIEEVVRLVGYENVPTSFPEGALKTVAGGRLHHQQRDIKRFLAGQGLSEAIFLSFSSRRLNALFPGLVAGRTAVAVRNPMTQDDTELQLSLCGGLVRSVRDNLAVGVGEVALFSVGKVFWREAEFREASHLGGVVCPGFPRAGLGRPRAADFVDAKGVVEALLRFLGVTEADWLPAPDLPSFHPGRTAQIELDGRGLGMFGCLHPATAEELGAADPCWLFELDLGALLKYCPRRVGFKELRRFPAVVRDLAVVADVGFAADELIRFVRRWNAASNLIEDVHLFDQYCGDPIPAGKKSLAYSISYRAPDRTLTDAEVSEIHAQLIAAVKDALHLEPR